MKQKTLSEKISQNYRHINTVIMIFSAMVNSFIVQSLSIINIEVNNYMPEFSTELLSFTALEFMIIHPFVGIFGNYIMDKKGLKIAISINCVLVIIGTGVRLFASTSFVFILVGNGIAAIGNIVIVNCPAKFSAVWYPPKQRVIITTLIALANSISGGLGAVFSPMFVKDKQTIEDGKSQIMKLLLFHFIVVGSVLLINLIFFRGTPKKEITVEEQTQEANQQGKQSLITEKQAINEIDGQVSQQNPSHDTNENQQLSQQKLIQSEPYIKTLKRLFTNKNYLLIFFTFVISLAGVNSLVTNLQLIIYPFGLTSSDASLSSALCIAAGITGSICSSLVLKKTKKYKRVLQIELFITIILYAAILGIIFLEIKVLYFMAVVPFSIFAYPLIPGLMEYVAEAMYPIGEGTVVGLLLGGGQMMSFVLGLVQSSILKEKTKQNSAFAILIAIGLYVIAFVTLSFSKEELKRLKANQ